VAVTEDDRDVPDLAGENDYDRDGDQRRGHPPSSRRPS
jgi:hypothetical protein